LTFGLCPLLHVSVAAFLTALHGFEQIAGEDRLLPPDDPRVRGTVAAIEQELMVDGLVLPRTGAKAGGAGSRKSSTRREQ
jgi:hypothetical protein